MLWCRWFLDPPFLAVGMPTVPRGAAGRRSRRAGRHTTTWPSRTSSPSTAPSASASSGTWSGPTPLGAPPHPRLRSLSPAASSPGHCKTTLSVYFDVVASDPATMEGRKSCHCPPELMRQMRSCPFVDFLHSPIAQHRYICLV